MTFDLSRAKEIYKSTWDYTDASKLLGEAIAEIERYKQEEKDFTAALKAMCPEHYPNEQWLGSLTCGVCSKAELAALRAEVASKDETLGWCSDFLHARDEMNARVHCSPVRLSPLTERVDLVLYSPVEAQRHD